MAESTVGLDRLEAAVVVAVIRAPTGQDAIAAADAVVEGGLRAIEITYSTPEPPRVIEEVTRRHGEAVLVGAGTVRCGSEARDAVAAGARFIVSPGIDEAVIRATCDAGVIAIAGGLTPTEVLRARMLGADAVKLFPASFGGPALLRALREPFPDIPFLPTGGVQLENLGEWFAAGAIAVGVGGALCPRDELEAGRFDLIRERAVRFAAAVPRTRP